MKNLLNTWEAENPQRIASMLTALGNVKASHLLDHSLFDFNSNRKIGNTIKKPVNRDVTPFAEHQSSSPESIHMVDFTRESPGRRTQ
jgi:tRNA 2-thiocytidine biosynthesis protein TtcA